MSFPPHKTMTAAEDNKAKTSLSNRTFHPDTTSVGDWVLQALQNNNAQLD